MEVPPMTKRYVVAAIKSWNRRVFEERICMLPGEWVFLDDPNRLTPDFLDEVKPRYVFFLHWSWVVPDEIVARWECVVFHMSDVPYGRGGSPLQNLIWRDHRSTKLSAIHMTPGLDAGPVYAKADLSLEGVAEEIYIRAAELSAQIIERLVAEEPEPIPQTGEPVFFERRHPRDSLIPACGSLARLHDFIRMLDAEGYPRAFLEHEGFRYELSRPILREGHIVADVLVTRLEEHT
jgi:methionyl-tRNA formyltransferase